MADAEAQTGVDRFLATGDEAGTAPGDRPFRPDVEGLRAVAVVLVVLYHSGVGFLGGGYIGVDVFFVISGFVITGVLLRERAATGATSVLAFYGRRCRRIIPAASLVIVATVALTYGLVGSAAGSRVAGDGRWASVFLANFHFASVGTDYLSSSLPPSPLQNFWSLGVEEQFYVVFPTLFLVLAGMRTRMGLRARLALGVGAATLASFVFSVLDTTSHPTSAYFSPFTRAWELGVGVLVALATPWLRARTEQTAAMATWLGLGAILVSAVAFGHGTAYPGWLAGVPVLGAGLVIAGGAASPLSGAEAVLGTAPARWLGRRSYSLYLWHWPVLVVAAEHSGHTTLPVPEALGWDLVALGLSVATFRLVENPVRHWALLRRVRWAGVGTGAVLVGATVGVIGVQVAAAGTAPSTARPPAPAATSPSQVRHLVARSTAIRTVPAGLDPAVSSAIAQPASNLGEPPASSGCVIAFSQSSAPACVFGDRAGTRTIVLYGDSHAGMWFQALDDIALRRGDRLVVLFKSACPAGELATRTRGVAGAGTVPWEACNRWHRWALARINHLDPALVVVSQALNRAPDGAKYTPGQWQRGLEAFLAGVRSPGTAKVVLGNIPTTGGPVCLSEYSDDVQACAAPPPVRYNQAERKAAVATRARYVSVTPWFCARTCSPVIGRFDVYFNASHVALPYTRYLENVLADALGLGGPGAPPRPSAP